MTTDPAETPTIVEIAEGFQARQAVDNIAWVDLGGQAVVIDALEQPELEAEVFSAIAASLGDTPVRYVLNTHTHYDHTALNEAFVRRWGAEIINQRTARTGPGGRWFDGPRRRVQWLPMPGCHTEEDCIAWVPEEKVLFTGDIFGWGLIPLTRPLTAETSRLLLDTYDRMIDLGAEVVVPGHGPLCTNRELQRWVEYFRWLQQQAAQRVAAGNSDKQIIAGIAPPEDMHGWWRFLQWKHADSVTKVVRAARRGPV